MKSLDCLSHDLRPPRARATDRPLRLDLEPGRFWSACLRPGQSLVSAAGRLWVTQSGRSEDVFLEAGQAWTAPGHGRVLAQRL